MAGGGPPLIQRPRGFSIAKPDVKRVCLVVLQGFLSVSELVVLCSDTEALWAQSGSGKAVTRLTQTEYALIAGPVTREPTVEARFL